MPARLRAKLTITNVGSALLIMLELEVRIPRVITLDNWTPKVLTPHIFLCNTK